MSKRIFVVDDSKTVRDVVQRTLSRAGYKVDVAAGGEETLLRAQQSPPDLFLIDLVMPDMGGLVLSERLRSIHQLSEIPIVIMSARAEELTTQVLVASGASDALAKPFGPEILRAVVGRALARRESMVPEEAAERRTINLLSDRAAERLAREMSMLLRDLSAAADFSTQELAQAILQKWGRLKLASVAYDVYRMASGVEQEITMEGRLDSIGLVDVLGLLQQEAKSGVLHLQYGHRVVRICLREGVVDMAIGEGGEREFLLGRFMIEEGVLTQEQLDAVMRNSNELGWLGERLVASGKITEAQLRKALVRQTSELLYEALRWSHGRFRFVENEHRAEADQARLGLPVASLIIEGVRRAEEWKVIEDKIYDYTMILDHRRDAVAGFETQSLTPDEFKVLSHVDGRRTVQQLVDDTSMSPYETCRILFRLMTAGLIGPKRHSSIMPPPPTF